MFSQSTAPGNPRTGPPASLHPTGTHRHLTVPKDRPRCGQRREATADSPVPRQQLVQRKATTTALPGRRQACSARARPRYPPSPADGPDIADGQPGAHRATRGRPTRRASGSEAASARAIHVPPRSFPGRSRRLKAAREGGRAGGGTHLGGRPQRSRSETGTGSGSPPTFGCGAKAIGQQPTAPNWRPVGVAHRDLPGRQGPLSGTTAPGQPLSEENRAEAIANSRELHID